MPEYRALWSQYRAFWSQYRTCVLDCGMQALLSECRLFCRNGGLCCRVILFCRKSGLFNCLHKALWSEYEAFLSIPHTASHTSTHTGTAMALLSECSALFFLPWKPMGLYCTCKLWVSDPLRGIPWALGGWSVCVLQCVLQCILMGACGHEQVAECVCCSVCEAECVAAYVHGRV